MKVEKAKTAGFCFGVREAIAAAKEAALAKKGGKVLTYGPLIHNRAVLSELSKLGISEIGSPEEISAEDTVIIRAHGIGPLTEAAISEKAGRVIDATCPYVKKIHRTVYEAARKGESIIICGDSAHPEVEGIAAYARYGGANPIIYADLETLKMAPPSPEKPVTVVAQTTFDQFIFMQMIDFLKEIVYIYTICPTICAATINHQAEAVELSTRCDAMIVIGGKQSSNTRKLYDLCRLRCPETYLIESAKDLYGIRFGAGCQLVGVTAGASTPDYIIQEVMRTMSENNVFEEMLNESLQEVHSGYVVTGTVVQVTENEIVFNIGYKCDGTMSRAEFGGTEAPLSEQVKTGDQMEVKVVKVGDSEVTLSRRRVIQDKAYEELEAAMESGTVLSGKIVEALDNGIIVDHNSVRVFIPSSLSDIRRVDLKTLVGQDADFRIIRLQRKRGRVMGDRRTVMQEQRAVMREETKQKLSVGARLTGTVKNITNYCAFVDLGGIDGMLHISEMGWGTVRNPNRYVKTGEEIEVEIKSYDPETDRISLTTRFPEANPWIGAEEKYGTGCIVHGKVVRFADFGAFVELETGIDALVHISHISHSFIKHPSEALKIGDEIEAKVIEFNPENKRISLSIRALEPEPEQPAEEEYFEEEPAEEAYEEEIAETVEAEALEEAAPEEEGVNPPEGEETVSEE